MVFRVSFSNINEKHKVKMNKKLVKHKCLNFGLIILNLNIKTMQNYATWI